MPYQRPIPDSDPHGKRSGAFQAWVQAEKFIQIILILPSAAFIGWAAGFGLDRLFHRNWIAMAGIVVGIVAGLVGVIRMAVYYTAKSDSGEDSGNDAGRQS